MITVKLATPDDAKAIAALRMAAGEELTHQFGKGHWSSGVTDRGVLFSMKRGRVYIAKQRNKLAGTFTLSTRKPWAIDRTYFTPCARPLYLTEMAVAPDLQRSGVGRACVEQAAKIATEWPANSICLDAYDAVAGAGEFYRKCGFREVGRVSYRNVPLIYFEMLL